MPLEQAVDLGALGVEPGPFPGAHQDLGLAQLGQAADVILVKMREHHRAHLVWLIADPAQLLG